MVLLTPLIRMLSQRFASPVDIVSSGGWSRPLLAGQPGVGDLFLLRSRRRPYLVSPDQWQLVRDLRARGVGPTWFLDPGGIGKSLLRRGGIGDEWLVDAADFPRRDGEHYLERFERVASAVPPALGTAPAPVSAPTSTMLEVSDAARADLADWLTRLGIADRPLLLVQAVNKRSDASRRSSPQFELEVLAGTALGRRDRRVAPAPSELATRCCCSACRASDIAERRHPPYRVRSGGAERRQ